MHRKMLDNPIVFKDMDHLGVWIYLLLSVTHSEHETIFGGQKYVLKPGQLITGRRKIAHDTGVEEHKVDRILKLFKTAQQIEQLSKPYGSVITILRWNDYQCCEPQSKQRLSNKRATNEQQMSTIQEWKEGKEINNTLKGIDGEFENLWKLYPRKEGKKDSLAAYKRARKNGTTYEEVEKGIKEYVRYIEAEQKDKQYIKKGETYFRGEHWQDIYDVEPADTTPQRPKRTQDEIAADIAHAQGMTLEEFKRAYGYD